VPEERRSGWEAVGVGDFIIGYRIRIRVREAYGDVMIEVMIQRKLGIRCGGASAAVSEWSSRFSSGGARRPASVLTSGEDGGSDGDGEDVCMEMDACTGGGLTRCCWLERRGLCLGWAEVWPSVRATVDRRWS
jgi:hypothetical protein